MHKKLKITILTDKSSWMNKYNVILKDNLEKLGHQIELVSQKNDLTKSDITFFLSCFEIINQSYLNLSKHNIVVHASDLPFGKGWSPMSWQILEGKNEIPITLFEATEYVDAGNYYLKDKIFLDGSELIDEWQKKLGNKIVSMCIKYINNYLTLEGRVQSGIETFYKKRKPADSELNINQTIKEQFNLLRIVDNNKYPAFFKLNGVKYKILIYKENGVNE